MIRQKIDFTAFSTKAISVATVLILFTTAASAGIGVYDFEVSPQNPEVGEEVSVSFQAEATLGDTVGAMSAQWPGTTFSENEYFCGLPSCEHTWTYTPQSSGQKTVEVMAATYQADTATDETTINVESSGQQPIAAFTYYPEDIEVGETVTFNAYCSGGSDLYCARDPDGGSIQTYLWDLNGNGDFYDPEDATGGTSSRTFDSPGTYTVGLKVMDDEGKWSEPYQLDIEVTEEENQAPNADFKYHPQNPNVGETISLDASCDTGTPCASDPDGSIQTYLWDLNGDGDYYDSSDATGSTASVSFDSSGSHTVGLKVQDDDGAWSEKTVDIEVSETPNEAPTAGFKISPQDADPGTTVTLNAGCDTGTPCASDPDGSITSYEWDLDDDGDYDDETGVMVGYSFSSTTEVGLRVEDDDGATDTKRKTVRITDYEISDYGPSGDVENPVQLFVELDGNPSTGWCKWEYGDTVSRSSSTLMPKPDGSEARWTYSKYFSEGSNTVTFQCFNHEEAITGERTTTFDVVGQEDGDLSIMLFEPVDEATDIDERPRFTFQGSYGERDGHEELEFELHVERGRNSDPFSGPDRTRSITLHDDERGSMRFDSDFSLGTWYSWGIEVSYGSQTVQSDIRNFKVRTADQENRDPTARFSWDDHPAVAGESVRFDASGTSDPDGDSIVQYRWYFDDGTGYRYGGPGKTHVFDSSGTYDVELRVKDSHGNYDTVNRDVQVVEAPGRCNLDVGSIRFGSDIIDEGDSTEASIQVSNSRDLQDFTLRFRVDGDTVRTYDDESLDEGESETYEATVSPDSDAMISVKLVTDGDPCGEQTFSRYRELVVVSDDDGDDGESVTPTPAFSWDPVLPQPGETVTFDASGSTDDGNIVQYKWFFGDGSSPGYGRKVDHTYQTEGTYTVQLVVEDDEGLTNSKTVDIPVSSEPGRCQVHMGSINFGRDMITEGESTQASVSLSNMGDAQTFDITVKEGSNTVTTRTVNLDSGEQRTITQTVSPERDRIITFNVRAEDGPCETETWSRSRELVVVARDGEASLEVNVRNEQGRRLSDAEVHVMNGEDVFRYTGSGGNAYFDLAQGSYQVRVSKPGYATETRRIDLQSGDYRRLTVTLGDADTGNFVGIVEDYQGNRLSGAEITATNGETRVRTTGTNGRAQMNLQPGTYTVTASKEGYSSWTETINIQRGERTTEVFRLGRTGQEEGLNIAEVNYPDSVCRGSTLPVTVDIENNAGFHEFVTLTGKGLGNIVAMSDFSLNAGENTQKTVRFTNVQGTGTEEFTVTVNNENSDSVTRNVQIRDCGTVAPGQASDISMQINYPVKPNMAVHGDIVGVSGFVNGVNGRTTVDISIDGRTKASVRTQPDGYYQTWITADEVGPKTVKAETGDVSATRPLRVIPTSTVTDVEAPVSVFEGQQFQVCAQVDSQITPEVVLERDGEVVKTKEARGRVCFDRQAREPGMHDYRVAALTSGTSNTASTSVRVLEMDTEASSFPGQIASVESGSGMVKVELYNTNEDQTRYHLNLEGLPETWISQSDRQVILDKGERRTVYFYLTPQEEGSYQPTITVESRGTEIYRDELEVIAGGTTESQPDRGPIQVIINLFTGLF